MRVSGVVWKEAPESAIQSAEEAGGVGVVALKDPAGDAGSHPPAHEAHGDETGEGGSARARRAG